MGYCSGLKAECECAGDALKCARNFHCKLIDKIAKEKRK